MYFPVTDRWAHRFSPESKAYCDNLRVLDSILGAAVARINDEYADAEFYLFSDHGNLRIHRAFNLWSLLESQFRPRDLAYFINSTIACFWTDKPSVLDALHALLASTRVGEIIDDAARINYRLPTNRDYGDLIFLADPHVEFVPNFLNPFESVPAGMHGYTPRCRAMDGIIAGPAERIAEVSDPTHIYDLVLSNARRSAGSR